MKKTLVIVGIIFAALVVSGFLKDQIVKTAVTMTCSKIVGAPLHIGSMSIGILSQNIIIKDLKLYNPPGFTNDVLLDMPVISVDYDLGSLLAGKLRVRNAIIDLHEVVIVNNKEGNLNVDSLKVVEDQKEASSGKKEQAPGKTMPMQIDTMTLSIGKVVFKNFATGDNKPAIDAYDVGIKGKSFKNITSAQQFVTLVLVEAMKPTAIRGAAVYGAATVLGVAFLPAGIAATLIGEDSSKAEFNSSSDNVYRFCLEYQQNFPFISS